MLFHSGDVGAITSYIDIAQVVLYLFWIFFFGLIIYLHREGKREGYPLLPGNPDLPSHVRYEGAFGMPEPKTYKTAHGEIFTAPNGKEDNRPIAGKYTGGVIGAALEPVGDPMKLAIGPGSYAERLDRPDLTFDGHPKIIPMRVAKDYWIEARDPDPRGKPVFGGDHEVAGTVSDIWVDLAESVIRYFEVKLPSGRSVLLPHNFTRVGDQALVVRSIFANQFEGVPATKKPDQVTLLEEERIMAYYGAGTLYATPDRAEPIV
ncbi:MAG: photosynthetic reaction center subunit H [Betaproteobacteria bacterium]